MKGYIFQKVFVPTASVSTSSRCVSVKLNVWSWAEMAGESVILARLSASSVLEVAWYVMMSSATCH